MENNNELDMVKDIRYRLLDGDTSGVREVSIPYRSYKLIVFPRSRLKELKDSGLNRAGIYFLFGEGDDGQSRCYIGQSKNVLERIKQHNVTKDFWQLAAGFTGDFGTTEIEHLEWQCVTQARTVGRFTVENSDEPSRIGKHQTTLDDDPLAEVFTDLRQFLTMIGQPVLEALTAIPMNENEIYECQSGPGGHGKGYYGDEGMVVLVGSVIRADATPSQQARNQALIEQLKSDGVVKQNDEGTLVFVKDHPFSSPSTPACIILGRSVNGWIEWKNKQGQTLDAAVRKAQ